MNQVTQKNTEKAGAISVRVDALVSCKLCGETPEIPQYKTDAGGHCSYIAVIVCRTCGNSVTKYSKNYPSPSGISDWDSSKTKYDQALHGAILSWNRLNSLKKK